MPFTSTPAWIAFGAVGPISPSGVMASTPLQDELPEPSPTRMAETTETNPVVSTTADTVETQFTIVLPLPEPTPGPSRTLATPRECSSSQALLTLGPRRPLRIVPQDAPVADADANGDPAPMDAD